jgi:type I restriction enzyme S subunit
MMEKVNLRSIVEFYIGGGWGKDSPQDTFVQSAYVIRGTDFDKVKIKPTQSVPYRFHTESNLRSRRLNIGDIVFEVSGGSKDQPVGRCILITAELLNSFDDDVIPASFCKKISPNQSLVNPYYFFAHLQHVWNTREIIQWQVQSTGLSNFNFESFLDEYQISLPPLPIQRRIAGILSAYEDLIENNQRRIAILEAMARGLYREWFVHYRYPGHEDVPLVDSPLGPIPQGWEVRSVKEIATVTYGFPFASNKFNTDGIGTSVIRIRDILDGSNNTFTNEDVEPKYHIRNGNILVGMDGEFHMCIWSSGHAYQNQRVAKFESNGEISNYHLYLALEQPIRNWNKSIVGTTVAHLGDMHIKMIQILWPQSSLLANARNKLEPMSEQIIGLKSQNINLRRTRDLLVPRLLSGQLDVGALDHA